MMVPSRRLAYLSESVGFPRISVDPNICEGKATIEDTRRYGSLVAASDCILLRAVMGLFTCFSLQHLGGFLSTRQALSLIPGQGEGRDLTRPVTDPTVLAVPMHNGIRLSPRRPRIGGSAGSRKSRESIARNGPGKRCWKRSRSPCRKRWNSIDAMRLMPPGRTSRKRPSSSHEAQGTPAPPAEQRMRTASRRRTALVVAQSIRPSRYDEVALLALTQSPAAEVVDRVLDNCDQRSTGGRLTAVL